MSKIFVRQNSALIHPSIMKTKAQTKDPTFESRLLRSQCKINFSTWIDLRFHSVHSHKITLGEMVSMKLA